RALKNNPDLIYEYVRNSIETVFIYGLQKGALGAEIDKSGTPFDQAMLMVELLRQAGYVANYQAGTITLTGQQFTDWTGISDATAACQLLSSGAIPAAVNGSTTANCAYGSGTAISSVQLAHVWVQVTIGGGTYVFDPSYKPHTWKTGIDLSTATGLTTGTPLSQASSGMDTGTVSSVPYVHNLNTESLNSQLSTYANNLLSYMSSNNLNGAEMEDIIGGGVINSYTSPSGGLRQTTLPYTSTLQHSWSGGVPNQYRTTLEVKPMTWHYSDLTTHSDTVMWDVSLYVDEIYGRRLTIDTAFGSSTVNTADATFYLGLDDVALATYVNASPTGFQGTLYQAPTHVILTVNHPYASAADGSSNTNGDYMDATMDKPVVLITGLTIVTGFGETSGLLAKWSEERASDTAVHGTTGKYCHWNTGDNESCTVNYQGTAGDFMRQKSAGNWLEQISRAMKLQAAVANAVPQLHHAIGLVYGDQYMAVESNGFNPPDWTIGDAFDRFDIDSAFSLTSKTADSATRRAAVQSIAASSATLEGSVAGQLSDVPDTSSTATHFDWGNRPPGSEDPTNAGPRKFLSFTSSNSSSASSVVLADNSTTGVLATNWSSTTGVQLGQTEMDARRAALANAVTAYANAGFTITASQETFLGPGQRGGYYIKNGNTEDYTVYPAKQRGAALIATKYDANGDPVEIAHLITAYNVVVGNLIAKGGGGSNQSDQKTAYDPAQAADILKSRFVDRSNALGVNLANGSLSTAAPATIKSGNGDFPYSLSGSLSWHPATPTDWSLGPPTLTAPRPGWTTNWHNDLTMSSSGLENMGKSDVRAAAGSIVAFLAAQDIYKSSPSTQRDVAAALTQSWWAKQMSGNVISVNIGGSARQFLKTATGTWITPGAGPISTVTVTGSRVPYEASAGPLCNKVYQLTRGWDTSGMSFAITGAQGDTQNFGYWYNNYVTNDNGENCGRIKGFRLTNWTFPQGITVSLAYNSTDAFALPDGGYIDRISTITNTLGRKVQFNYTAGYDTIASISNGLTGADARTIAFAYSDENLASITDPIGAVTSFTYLPLVYSATTTQRQEPSFLLDKIFTADNALAANVDYDYDGLNRVKQVKDAVAIQQGGRNPYSFYIADGTRGERDDPLGNAYAVTYDTKGRPAKYTDELGHITLASWDARGRVLNYTYPEGDCELFGYDDRNNTVSYKKIDKTSSCNPNAGSSHVLSISATWDSTWNKPLTITNARGLTTTFTYNASGNGTSLMATATRPTVTQGTPVYSFTYNSVGKLLTATDPTGLVTSNTYDAVTGDLLSTVLDPGASPHVASTTSFTYNALGDAITATDPRGNVGETAYDADRRPTQTLHHDGSIAATLNAASRTTYDILGRVTKEEAGTVFSGTSVTTWLTTKQATYTPTSKVATATDADNRVVSTAYDAVDRPDVITDPIGRKSHFTYDAAGETLVEYRAWTSTLQEAYATYTYTPNGKQASVYDADGSTHITAFAYDGFDRLLTTTFPDATTEQLSYDADGDVLTKLNRSGQTLTFTYDALDRLATKLMPASPSNITTTWTYDLAGRITNLSDTPGNQLAYSFDTAMRVTSVATTIPGLSGAKTISYQYDVAGNRTRLTWPDAYYVNYSYDTLGRMSWATDSGSTTLATFSYNPLSRLTNISDMGGGAATVDLTYSNAGDPLTLTHNLSGTADDNTFTYTYTNAHQTASLAASNAVW
ncbi:MAG: RHS repeat protein, partial [Proteobacteria bacterium]|nr:RHS repeat protein [Pseudomonadota bacterium]